jgi:hypothetical protein
LALIVSSVAALLVAQHKPGPGSQVGS